MRSIHPAVAAMALVCVGPVRADHPRSDLRGAHFHADEHEADLHQLGDSRGIGDLTALGQYRFPKSGATEAAVLVGVKAPTGDGSRKDALGATFAAERLPGSGAWDGLLGSALTRRLVAFSIDASRLYTLAGGGTQQTNLGDRRNYDLAISWRPGGAAHAHGDGAAEHAHLSWVLVFELNGDRWKEVEVAGARDGNTGGSLVYASPRDTSLRCGLVGFRRLRQAGAEKAARGPARAGLPRRRRPGRRLLKPLQENRVTTRTSAGGARGGAASAWLAAWLVAAALIAAPAQAADPAGEGQRIRSLIGKTWDQPAARVQTDPVVVVGDWALAAWSQGERGGRALLQRQRGNWEVMLCAGAAFTRAAALTDAGVPAATARRLATRLAAAEAKVPAERRRRFDLFGPDGLQPLSHRDANSGQRDADSGPGTRSAQGDGAAGQPAATPAAGAHEHH